MLRQELRGVLGGWGRTATMQEKGGAQPVLLCASLPGQTGNVCVCVRLCVRIVLILGLQKHDVRNVAKHPSCKSMEGFTRINKQAFQKNDVPQGPIYLHL